MKFYRVNLSIRSYSLNENLEKYLEENNIKRFDFKEKEPKFIGLVYTNDLGIKQLGKNIINYFNSDNIKLKLGYLRIYDPKDKIVYSYSSIGK